MFSFQEGCNSYFGQNFGGFLLFQKACPSNVVLFLTAADAETAPILSGYLLEVFLSKAGLLVVLGGSSTHQGAVPTQREATEKQKVFT